jgi:hypothetical protein
LDNIVQREESLSGSLAGGITLRSIVHSFPVFNRMILIFFRGPRKFIQERPVDPKIMLNDAFLFFIYSISISFLLTIPEMMVTHVVITKWQFLLIFLVGNSKNGVYTHLCCKASKGKGTFRQTFASILYMGGIVIPIGVICLMPVQFIVGPNWLKNDDQFNFDAYSNILKTEIIAGLVVGFLFAVMTSYYLLRWLSYIHKVPAKRIAGIYLLLMPLFFLVDMFILQPIENIIVPAIIRGLGFL